jgi:hypothetical protein
MGKYSKSPEEVCEKIRLSHLHISLYGLWRKYKFNLCSVGYLDWVKKKKETWRIGQGTHVLGIACNFGH